MEEAILSLKCKDFDALSGFFTRLAKIGSHYILKNDCYIATQKNQISKTSSDKYIGKHIIRDPFFCDDETYYIKHAVYLVGELPQIVEDFKKIKENAPEKRKRITLHRNIERIYIVFADDSEIELARLGDKDSLEEDVKQTANLVTEFQDIITTSETVSPNGFIDLSEQDLIDLRDDHLKELEETINGRRIHTRIARSLFPLAGITRTGNAFATYVKTIFLPSDQSDIAILRMHTLYPCSGSNIVKLDCIHEYLILAYAVEGEEKDE